MSQKIIRRVVIHGKVQGVGFRFWAENVAGAHGLEGWVRNLRDGAVEALFAGRPEAVAAMVEDCRRGPPSARVARVDEFEASQAELNLRKDGGLFASLPTV